MVIKHQSSPYLYLYSGQKAPLGQHLTNYIIVAYFNRNPTKTTVNFCPLSKGRRRRINDENDTISFLKLVNIFAKTTQITQKETKKCQKFNSYWTINDFNRVLSAFHTKPTKNEPFQNHFLEHYPRPFFIKSPPKK